MTPHLEVLAQADDGSTTYLCRIGDEECRFTIYRASRSSAALLKWGCDGITFRVHPDDSPDSPFVGKWEPASLQHEGGWLTFRRQRCLHRVLRAVRREAERRQQRRQLDRGHPDASGALPSNAGRDELRMRGNPPPGTRFAGWGPALTDEPPPPPPTPNLGRPETAGRRATPGGRGGSEA